MKRFLYLLALLSLCALLGCGAKWLPDDGSSGTGPTPQPAPQGGSLTDVQADTPTPFTSFKYTVGTLTGATTTTVSIIGANDTGSGTGSTSSYTIKRASDSTTVGPFDSSSPVQTVSSGDEITVQHTSANSIGGIASSFLTVGSARATYSSTTSQLSFPTILGQGPSTNVQSNIVSVPATLPKTVTFPATIVIDTANTTAANSEIWIGGQLATSSAINNTVPLPSQQALQIRQTTSATPGATVTTTATITGANSNTYSITFKTGS